MFKRKSGFEKLKAAVWTKFKTVIDLLIVFVSKASAILPDPVSHWKREKEK